MFLIIGEVLVLCSLVCIDSIYIFRVDVFTPVPLPRSVVLLSFRAMPVVQVTLHPRGMHPTESARAWYLHEEEGMGLRDVQTDTQTHTHKHTRAHAPEYMRPV